VDRLGVFCSLLAAEKWTVGAGLSFGWVTAPALDLGYWYRRCLAEKVHPNRRNQATFYNSLQMTAQFIRPFVAGC
jgi:hypothetical protein